MGKDKAKGDKVREKPIDDSEDQKPANLQTKVPIYYKQFIDSLKGMDVKELGKLGNDLRKDLPKEVMGTLAPGQDFKRYSGRRGTNYIRRFFHILASLSVIYYFLGTGLFGVPKEIVVFIALSVIPLAIDTFRIKSGRRIFGIRDHEEKRVASYVWFTHGSLILILLCPQQIAVPVIIAASWGDPIIGEIRRFRRSIAFSVGILFCCAVFLAYGYYKSSILLAIFAGCICFIGEATEFGFRWSLRRDLFYSRHREKESRLAKYSTFLTKTDDDFTMQFFPGMVLLIVYLLSPNWFPEPLIEPLSFLVRLA
jgi:dolichol kinase